jgi:putative exosortase-associated protein (TIGR04073 family)
MVRRFAAIVIVIILGLTLASPAYCDDMFKKLGRGFCNLVTFPLEVPEQIQRTNIDEGPMAALTWGPIKGISMMCVRAAAGAYEVLTFPFPIPKDYKPLLTDPEFFMEDKSW